MTKQAFRDVNTVSVFGTAMTGVRVARLADESDEINYNADANQYRQDVGITRQLVRTQIDRLSSDKLRDLLSATFTAVNGDNTGSAALGRVQRVRISQEGTELMDSGDAATWLEWVGVEDINGRVEVTFRDKAQLHTQPMVKGTKGTLTVKASIPRTAQGLPAATASDTHVVTCELISIEDQAEHGALGEARAVFAMYGATDPWSESGPSGGALMKQVTIGAEGAIAWTSPAADASSGEAVSVANGIAVRQEVEFAHGELTRASYHFTHYSSDGTSTPIS